MAKLILVLALISVCLNTVWIDWNDQFVPTNFTLPALPTFNGLASATRLPYLTTNDTRKFQYGYEIAAGNQKCKVYCGPKSYLTTDQNGDYFCKRDLHSIYYGGRVNGGTNFTEFCNPTLESNCVTVIGVLRNLKPGNCNSVNWTGAYAVNAGKSCCYNNNNPNGTINAVLEDLTDISIFTDKVTLRNSEN